jgi:hypothetical protein
MTPRAGRRNGVYAWVPLRLANDCPRCGVTRGRKCGRMVGQRWVSIEGTHAERKAIRRSRG